MSRNYKSQKKTKRVTVPVTEEVEQEFSNNADKCNMSDAEYVRTLHDIFGDTLVKKTDSEEGLIDQDALNDLKSKVKKMFIEEEFR